MTYNDAVNANPFVQISSLTKHYGNTLVLNDISFQVGAGEFVAVLGPSGSGKTTLFRCLSRLIEPDKGTINILDHPLQAATGSKLQRFRREIGVIFQQFNLIQRLSALENVLAGRLGYVSNWRALLRRFSYSDRQLALASLDQVGMLAQAYQRADSLSGGQQQRVAIAKVLAQKSRVILADEPIASLDPQSASSVLETLRKIAHENNIAVICSLHQVDLAIKFADRIIGLTEGRVVCDTPVVEFTQNEQNLIYRSEKLSAS